MKKPNIILTGFMATGKTSVGRLLSEHLGYEFIDTDHLIETRAGQCIADIFRDKGEAAFRAMESQLARELGDREGLVISTGGRLMLDAGNAAALGRTGRVFCLVATPEEIMDRVGQDTGPRRPLLEVPNPLQRIVELLQTRKDQYEQFLQLATSDKTVSEVTSYLEGLLQADPDLRLPIAASSARYEYIVGGGILSFIRQLANIKGAMAIVTDGQVGPLYAERCGPVETVITIPPGGRHKNLESVCTIVDRLVDAGFDRNGTIVALGGAVISELAGFVAATYMRGVDCVQCPTSLLAMVDTSVGGKTGIDLPKGKNLLGVFKHPKAVIVDVATLQSLSPREFAAGMAEVVKHALIADTGLLGKIEKTCWQLQPGMVHAHLVELQELVAQSIQIKIRIVQEDPLDRGPRALLNLGHTFAHAIEHASEFTLRHGEAVAIGLVAALDLSVRLGFCAESLQQRIEGLLRAIGLPTRMPAGIDRYLLLAAMGSDKKRSARKLRFVLLRDIGDAFVTDAVPSEALAATLDTLAP